MKILQQWGIKIEQKAIEFKSHVIDPTSMKLANNKNQQCDAMSLRNLAIQRPMDLKKGEWAIAYHDPRNYDNADNVLKTMKQACGRLGIRVEDPEWIPIKNFDNVNQFENDVTKWKEKCSAAKIVLIMLPYESYYPAFKRACYG